MCPIEIITVQRRSLDTAELLVIQRLIDDHPDWSRRRVMELYHPSSGKGVARKVPDPSERQQKLLEALKLTPPATLPEAKVTVGTRKKINKERKPPVK